MPDDGDGKQKANPSTGLPAKSVTDTSQTALLKIDNQDQQSQPPRLSKEQLSQLVDPKSVVDLAKLGGIGGLAAALGVDLQAGIANSEQEAELRAEYGPNTLPRKAAPGLLTFLWLAMQDRILIFLSFAALVSLAIGIYRDVQDGTMTHWIEGAAIMVAVVLVVLVNGVNDWQKDRQFRALSARAEDRLVRAVRGGSKCQDILPTDGVLIEGHGICCDESGATGESDTIQKDSHRDPFFLSGTKVLDGSGRMFAIAVGENSYHGRMMNAMQVQSHPTPLQLKLAALAETIGRFGFSAALFMLSGLVFKYILSGRGKGMPASAIIEAVLEMLIQSVTVIVVAVPEGLPMAVTLALAFATGRMLKDNNLVRVLASCETMGSATSICSDKTGTLTENRMTVVRALLLGSDDAEQAMSKIALDVLAEGLAVNSTAFSTVDPVTQKITFVGSKTEAALLGFLAGRLEYSDYVGMRAARPIFKLWPFASERKSMSTLVQTTRPNGTDCLRMHCKGAAEMVLKRCKRWMGPDGTLRELVQADRDRFTACIEGMSMDALRTIAVAFRDLAPGEQGDEGDAELVLLAILGIEDPLRDGVPEAVASCQRAGIQVRMVTGDGALTARSIARRAGIYTPGGIVLEGPTFRQLTDEALGTILPRLQVLARSSPLDKQRLVGWLQAQGEVVAVTGDGTNDGPALRAANVGFAMGIAGTEVAKAAADIVLLDDNFTSIVKAVSWGRCVNDAVRKFLQFQLTVNVAAVLVAIVSALAGQEGKSALSAVQLLWVNLIMDSFAALALATDRPTPDLLERAPEPSNAPLITPGMWVIILGQAIYQLTAILLILFLGPSVFPNDLAKDSLRPMSTFVFNTFVFMQLFNELNCRCLGRKWNVFAGLSRNWIFSTIWLGTVGVQVLLVFFGGHAFNTEPISLPLWLTSLGLGFVSLPLGALLRLIPVPAGSQQRLYMSPERIRWQAAAESIRRGLSVVRALRRPVTPL